MKGVKMTEKDFLIEFIDFYFSNLPGYEGVSKHDKGDIDEFLTEHHKEYYEVEFVTKDEMDKHYKQLEEGIGFDQEGYGLDEPMTRQEKNYYLGKENN
jgi:hypothetical protein